MFQHWWQKKVELCAVGDIANQNDSKIQNGACAGEMGCDSELIFDILWDETTCDDDCHHLEVWRKINSGTSCTGGTYAKKVDDQACGTAGNGCSKGAYDACWRDSNVDYALDSGEVNADWHAFCYRIDIRRDGSDALDESLETSQILDDTIWCAICGTT